MVKTFSDTSGLIALFNQNDALHRRAIEVRKAIYHRKVPMVTTEFVLLEIADAFCVPSFRARLVEYIQELREEPSLEIIPVSSELMERGLQLYGQRLDKDWSLTDCISFVVMTERGIADAFASDHHFEQAGFCTLL